MKGDGADDTLDVYYCLVWELYTVTGMMKQNGTLAEACDYSAYGTPDQLGYRDFDFDRDGDVDSTDNTSFQAAEK